MEHLLCVFTNISSLIVTCDRRGDEGTERKGLDQHPGNGGNSNLSFSTPSSLERLDEISLETYPRLL